MSGMVKASNDSGLNRSLRGRGEGGDFAGSMQGADWVSLHLSFERGS